MSMSYRTALMGERPNERAIVIQRKKDNIIMIQAAFRSFIARKSQKYASRLDNIISLQARIRGEIARQNFSRILKQKNKQVLEGQKIFKAYLDLCPSHNADLAFHQRRAIIALKLLKKVFKVYLDVPKITVLQQVNYKIESFLEKHSDLKKSADFNVFLGDAIILRVALCALTEQSTLKEIFDLTLSAMGTELNFDQIKDNFIDDVDYFIRFATTQNFLSHFTGCLNREEKFLHFVVPFYLQYNGQKSNTDPQLCCYLLLLLPSKRKNKVLLDLMTISKKKSEKEVLDSLTEIRAKFDEKKEEKNKAETVMKKKEEELEELKKTIEAVRKSQSKKTNTRELEDKLKLAQDAYVIAHDTYVKKNIEYQTLVEVFGIDQATRQKIYKEFCEVYSLSDPCPAAKKTLEDIWFDGKIIPKKFIDFVNEVKSALECTVSPENSDPLSGLEGVMLENHSVEVIASQAAYCFRAYQLSLINKFLAIVKKNKDDDLENLVQIEDAILPFTPGIELNANTQGADENQGLFAVDVHYFLDESRKIVKSSLKLLKSLDKGFVLKKDDVYDVKNLQDLKFEQELGTWFLSIDTFIQSSSAEKITELLDSINQFFSQLPKSSDEDKETAINKYLSAFSPNVRDLTFRVLAYDLTNRLHHISNSLLFLNFSSHPVFLFNSCRDLSGGLFFTLMTNIGNSLNNSEECYYGVLDRHQQGISKYYPANLFLTASKHEDAMLKQRLTGIFQLLSASQHKIEDTVFLPKAVSSINNCPSSNFGASVVELGIKTHCVTLLGDPAHTPFTNKFDSMNRKLEILYTMLDEKSSNSLSCSLFSRLTAWRHEIKKLHGLHSEHWARIESYVGEKDARFDQDEQDSYELNCVYFHLFYLLRICNVLKIIADTFFDSKFYTKTFNEHSRVESLTFLSLLLNTLVELIDDIEKEISSFCDFYLSNDLEKWMIMVAACSVNKEVQQDSISNLSIFVSFLETLKDIKNGSTLSFDRAMSQNLLDGGGVLAVLLSVVKNEMLVEQKKEKREGFYNLLFDKWEVGTVIDSKTLDPIILTLFLDHISSKKGFMEKVKDEMPKLKVIYKNKTPDGQVILNFEIVKETSPIEQVDEANRLHDAAKKKAKTKGHLFSQTLDPSVVGAVLAQAREDKAENTDKTLKLKSEPESESEPEPELELESELESDSKNEEIMALSKPLPYDGDLSGFEDVRNIEKVKKATNHWSTCNQGNIVKGMRNHWLKAVKNPALRLWIKENYRQTHNRGYVPVDVDPAKYNMAEHIVGDGGTMDAVLFEYSKDENLTLLSPSSHLKKLEFQTEKLRFIFDNNQSLNDFEKNLAGELLARCEHSLQFCYERI